jgi:D-glycero-alpha-D-manno-heptose-7-phosphate kinase
MKQIYRSRAPLRLGLAGGGTDVGLFSHEQGGLVLNATIDLYAQAILEPLENEKNIWLSATDRNEHTVLNSESFLEDQEPLRLHKGIYNRIIREFNNNQPLSFKLTTFADAPAGSGLGTSSTMVVCIIQVFSEWLGLGLGEYEVARLAYEIEREELLLAGGKQDQYAASFGGFNFIEFGPGDRVLVNPLRIKEWVLKELEVSTVLFYTGQSRESAKIIEQQINVSKANETSSYDAMCSLKHYAILMKEALLRGDLYSYAKILQQSWEVKKKLSSSVTNSNLDAIYDSAISAGAIAGKISGAGGGGFFMFFSPPENRMSVIEALKKHDGQVMNFHFTSDGVQSWSQFC